MKKINANIVKKTKWHIKHKLMVDRPNDGFGYISRYWKFTDKPWLEEIKFVHETELSSYGLKYGIIYK